MEGQGCFVRRFLIGVIKSNQQHAGLCLIMAGGLFERFGHQLADYFPRKQLLSGQQRSPAGTVVAELQGGSRWAAKG